MDRPSRIFRCWVFIGTLFFAGQYVVSGTESVCRQQLCEATGVQMLVNANFSVDPCDDFYEHACGLFIRQQNIPPYQLSHGYAQMLTKQVQEKLKQLVEVPVVPDDAPLVKDAKIIYKACMDTVSIDADGYDTFEHYMDRVGGWPMITDQDVWEENGKSWDAVHHYFKRLTGVGSLVDLRVYAHRYTDNVPMIHLEEPRFLYGVHSPFMTTTQLADYTQFLKDVALLFIEARGDVVSRAQLNTDVLNVLEFRKKLAENMTWGDEARKVEDAYSTYTLQDLQDWYEDSNIILPKPSRVNWTKLVMKSFLFDMTPLNPSQKVVIRNPKYMFNLMYTLGTTATRVIINHICLHFVENFIRYAPAAVREKGLSLYRKLTGLPGLAEADRWKFCLTEHPLQHVLGKMYSDSMLPRTTKFAAQVMAERIEIKLKTKIRLTTWIDAPTQKKAVQKLSKLQIVAGYPDWYDIPAIQVEYYVGQMAGDEALANALSYAQNEYRIETVALRSVPPRTSSHEYPTDRTVVYLVEKNALHINAAMLQWPYFSEALPDYINYATLGVMIAREMIHAIDLIGIRFDENGRPEDWWGKSLRTYQGKLGCIVNKYTTKNELNLSPYSNQIADTLAIRLAADAYFKQAGPPRIRPPMIPGLKQHERVTFYLASATFVCEKIHPIYNDTLAQMDLYNLPPYKINIPAMLSWDFNRVHECYTFSPMNPQSKCDVWNES